MKHIIRVYLAHSRLPCRGTCGPIDVPRLRGTTGGMHQDDAVLHILVGMNLSGPQPMGGSTCGFRWFLKWVVYEYILSVYVFEMLFKWFYVVLSGLKQHMG